MEGMELQELGWELVRNVGLVEADSQEEGRGMILSQELLGSLGDLDIRQGAPGLVGHHHGAEHVGVASPSQICNMAHQGYGDWKSVEMELRMKK